MSRSPVPRRRCLSTVVAASSMLAAVVGAIAPSPAAAAAIPQITLPIAVDYIDEVTWTDTWGAPRSGGRSHVGVDMLGPKMTPMVAVADGTITWMRHNSSSGNIIYLTDDAGWRYTYIHINNDTPGTDDGANRYDQAFGPGIEKGARVKAGQLIAYMGDSGNAEWTVPHLHFEITDPSGQSVNPTSVVDAARERALISIPDVDPALVAPFADFSTFADTLFGVTHGRSASNPELVALAGLVQSDGLDSAVASVVSPTTPGASLDRLYEAYFLRQADTSGYNYWMLQFRNGASLSNIAEWFAQSEEFRDRYEGLGFDVFLDQLYRDVLGREPDQSGKTYWLNLLANGELTRGSIVVQFTESAELISRTQARTELTLVSLVFTQQVPNANVRARWQALDAAPDVKSLVRALYLEE